MTDNSFDIFNVTGDVYTSAVTTEDDVRGNSDFYKPRLTNDIKEYKARLRYVPNVNNPGLSVIAKWGYYFRSDPAQPERSLWIDCTSNVKGAKPNIFTQAFWYLRNQESAVLQQLSRNFSRKQYFWMLAYIMQDNNDPELNGKVKITRFGVAVKNKHDEELNGDPSLGLAGCTFYNPMAGKDFFLKIDEKKIKDERTGKMKTITNYDNSKFDADVTPFGFIDPSVANGIQINRITDSSADKEKLVSFLKENSPDLSQMQFIPWTDADREKAEIIVRNIVDNDLIFDKIYFKTYGNKPVLTAKQPVPQSTPGNTTPTNGENTTASVVDQVTKSQPDPVQQPAVEAADNDDPFGDLDGGDIDFGSIDDIDQLMG